MRSVQPRYDVSGMVNLDVLLDGIRWVASYPRLSLYDRNQDDSSTGAC
jgi:hypothetical protein